MSRREAILAAIGRGERYKNIAVDLNCFHEWISRVAIQSGRRKKRNRRQGHFIQTSVELTEETLAELKSRGSMAMQIRQAVEEYLERNRNQPHRRSHEALHRGPDIARP